MTEEQVLMGRLRDLAKRAFERNEVQLNSRVTTENAVNLKPGDVFSVRGKGKFILESIGGTTKRGRTYVNVKRYQ